MKAQPKAKTKAEFHFDEQAKKQTEKNVAKSKARDAKQGINGHECEATGKCTEYCGDCGS